MFECILDCFLIPHHPQYPRTRNMNPFSSSKRSSGGTSKTGAGGVLSSIGGAVAGAAAATVLDVGKLGRAAPPPPPPPVVWYITLRRKPCLTPEDEPEITEGGKFCIQLFVVPPAFVLYVIGWLVLSSLYCFAVCCVPFLGTSILALMAERSRDRKLARQDQRAAIEGTAMCSKFLLNLLSFTAFRLIRPFYMFISW